MPSVLEQIRKLDEQKATLLDSAKQEALTAAQTAIASLAELGFNYKLVEGESSPQAIGRSGNGTRRTGIRDQVLHAIETHRATGISRSRLLVMMGSKGDKSAEQSISNALAALKKGGSITLEAGVYKTA